MKSRFLSAFAKCLTLVCVVSLTATNLFADDDDKSESKSKSTTIKSGDSIFSIDIGNGGGVKIRSNAAQQLVSKHWVGIHAMPVSPVLKSQLRIESGLAIHAVMDDSPAAKAGLKSHDVIVSINGENVSNLIALMKAIDKGGAEPAKLEVFRAGKKRNITVTPEERPEKVITLPLEHNLGEHADHIKKLIEQLQDQAGGKGVKMFRLGEPFILEDFDVDVEGIEIDADEIRKKVEEMRTRAQERRKGNAKHVEKEPADIQQLRKEMKAQMEELRKQVEKLQKEAGKK